IPLAQAGGGDHRVVHGPDVGVEAGAGILDVEDQSVHTRPCDQVGPLGLRGAVRVVDRDAGARVGAGALAATRLRGAAERVRAPEGGGEAHVAGPVHEVDKVLVFGVDAGRVGDDAAPLPGQ